MFLLISCQQNNTTEKNPPSQKLSPAIDGMVKIPAGTLNMGGESKVPTQPFNK